MRLLLLSFIPLLLQVATAYYDDSDFYAREYYPDSLSTRSDALTHLSTRELLGELSLRLERRGSCMSKADKDFKCDVCDTKFPCTQKDSHPSKCTKFKCGMCDQKFLVTQKQSHERACTLASSMKAAERLQPMLQY
ncbi:hypothetical protein D9611_013041 [Ephemerocybe angulata]|uniref:Uncharacterized protein n=1 Tax=Ephemerocybe angulata TaxID=980116 RepID=A0A8H5ESZ1_9AGAR|nr:hypothetical protein D9611_013041 [Tulosesus angulatus]